MYGFSVALREVAPALLFWSLTRTFPMTPITPSFPTYLRTKVKKGSNLKSENINHESNMRKANTVEHFSRDKPYVCHFPQAGFLDKDTYTLRIKA